MSGGKWKFVAVCGSVIAVTGLTACSSSGSSPTASRSASTPGNTATPGGAVTGSAAPVLSGKCGYVTLAEISRATGIAAIKPVETDDGCAYLFGADATLPSPDPSGVDNIVFPPSVEVYWYPGTAGTADVTRDLADPAFAKVTGVGTQAGWNSDIDELAVRLPNGTARIDVNPPDDPTQLSGTDLRAIAVQIFTAAQPHMH